MKDLTQDYIDFETGVTKNPVEIYKFWTDSDSWYFTSSDTAVTYDGHEYVPIPITRDALTQNEDPASNVCNITISRLTEPAVQYVATIPMHTVEVMIIRLHRTQDPIEGEVKFAGYVEKHSLKGVTLQLTCSSIAKWLEQNIPNYLIEPGCNASLFDDECKLVAADYQTNGTISFSNELGTVLIADEFALQEDGYFNLGHILINGHRRMITQHIGTSVTMRYPIPVPTVGDSFSAWPGCDGSIEMCLAKYHNKDNHRGYPDVPLDNPTLWV